MKTITHSCDNFILNLSEFEIKISEANGAEMCITENGKQGE